jgi:hypothetical protein
MSTPYQIKNLFVNVGGMEQTAGFAKEFVPRFQSLCEAAQVPTLPASWAGVHMNDDLPPLAERQLQELYRWLRKQFPAFESLFRT